MLELKFKCKTIWAKDRFHPINDDAIAITRLTGKKTLTAAQLAICKEAGWKIIIPFFDVDKYLLHLETQQEI